MKTKANTQAVREKCDLILVKHEDLEIMVNNIKLHTKDMDSDLSDTFKNKLDKKTFESQMQALKDGLNSVEKRL